MSLRGHQHPVLSGSTVAQVEALGVRQQATQDFSPMCSLGCNGSGKRKAIRPCPTSNVQQHPRVEAANVSKDQLNEALLVNVLRAGDIKCLWLLKSTLEIQLHSAHSFAGRQVLEMHGQVAGP
eukprot:5816243-Amphidinium_carterae.2